jgi:hypothetical protein
MTTFTKTLAFGLLLCVPPIGMANPGGGGDRPPGPPPESIDACADLVEDDICSFEGRDQEVVTGTCMAGPREDLPLACRPDDRRGPPPRD